MELNDFSHFLFPWIFFLSFAHLPLGLRVVPTCFCGICSLFCWWCWRTKLLLTLLTTSTLHRHVAGVPFLCFKCGLYSQLFRNLWVVWVSVTSKSLWQKKKPSDSCLTWLITLCVSHLGLWCCVGRDWGFLVELKSSENHCLFCVVSFSSLECPAYYLFIFLSGWQDTLVPWNQGMCLSQSKYEVGTAFLHTALGKGFAGATEIVSA